MVAQPHLPRVRALQGWVVTDVERLEGEVVSLCGVGGVCEAMKTGLLLAGLRINFNQRAPLAGFIIPCVAVWDRSGSINVKHPNCSSVRPTAIMGNYFWALRTEIFG